MRLIIVKLLYGERENLMKIHYSSRKLQKILTDRRLIKKHYAKFHHRLEIRLSELRAANSLADISNHPPPRRHKLSGSYKDCWGVDITRNYRIIVRPVSEYNINDLTTIKEVMIIDIDDYH